MQHDTYTLWKRIAHYAYYGALNFCPLRLPEHRFCVDCGHVFVLNYTTQRHCIACASFYSRVHFKTLREARLEKKR